MNEIPRHSKTRPTTQAAEGVPRLRWTLAEFERLAELGMFTEDDRIELIGGELVPMSPKGNRHEIVRAAIHNWLRRNLPNDIDYHAEPGWRADATHYCEPDFLVGPAGFNPTTVRPKDVMLLVEVAHWSLKFDTTIKADMYASLGVREYWVVNARTLATRVHRDPSAKEYGNVVDVKASKALVPLLLPGLTLKLSSLDIE
jgi:Uma2 family endonuclease